MSKPLKGDELRYLAYAENLTQGFYTDSENPDLSNGPGYPFVLLPFVAIGSNLLFAKLLNAIFVFIGICFLYETLLFYTKRKFALRIAIIIGLYPPLIKWMPALYSESLSFLCVSAFLFYFCSVYQKKKKWRSVIFASLFLGFLVLTKVVFFHVVVVSTIALTILILTKKQKKTKWALFVAFGAFIVTSPFIIYSYSVTGKLFYLGTRGGEILYHRSTPFENEYGNWFSADKILKHDNESDSKDLTMLTLNHKEFYLAMQPLNNIQKDSVFKAKAIENMKAYPIKYFKNTVANTSRFLFNLPNSYQIEELKTFGYIIPNGIIIVLFGLLCWPAFRSRKKIPFEVNAALWFSLIYGAGMIILLGKPRYFIMMMPSLVVFLVYGYSHILKISFVRESNIT